MKQKLGAQFKILGAQLKIAGTIRATFQDTLSSLRHLENFLPLLVKLGGDSSIIAKVTARTEHSSHLENYTKA